MARNTENNNKNRKSEAQEIYEQADNAGRFAGDDADSKAAREQAIENIRQDTGSSSAERNKNENASDEEARRDPSQSKDYKGEAQNVNDDAGRPLDPQEVDRAVNKATEGQRQERDRGSAPGNREDRNNASG